MLLGFGRNLKGINGFAIDFEQAIREMGIEVITIPGIGKIFKEIIHKIERV